MGLSIKYFIFDEKSDNFVKISNNKFEKLFTGDNSVFLKEYAGQTIKYISVVAEYVNRKPVFINKLGFHYMKIDKNGQFDRNYIDELRQTAASTISISSIDTPENVIESSAEFALKKFKNQYTWSPSTELKTRIERLIFIKNQNI